MLLRNNTTCCPSLAMNARGSTEGGKRPAPKEEPKKNHPMEASTPTAGVAREGSTLTEQLLAKAAASGDAEMCRLLLGEGAQVDAESENGMTALMQASAAGHNKCAVLLLIEGADVNLAGKLKGDTALMHAALNGHARMINECADCAVDALCSEA